MKTCLPVCVCYMCYRLGCIYWLPSGGCRLLRHRLGPGMKGRAAGRPLSVRGGRWAHGGARLLDEAQVDAPEVHAQVVQQAAAEDAFGRVWVARRQLRLRVLLPVRRLPRGRGARGSALLGIGYRVRLVPTLPSRPCRTGGGRDAAPQPHR